MCNADIRREIAFHGLRHWQIAKALEMAEGTFSRKLRSELPDETKAQIRAIIKKLSKEGDPT